MKTSDTFCALPWVHLSTRPNGHMRVCCTANASGVQNPDSQDKIESDIGILKNDDGMPSNLANTSLADAWNNNYMRGTRKAMMRGEKPVEKDVLVLDDWAWAFPTYSFILDEKKKVKQVIIDPDQRTADINRDNNSIVFKKIE